MEVLANTTRAIVLQYKCIKSIYYAPQIYTVLYVKYISIKQKDFKLLRTMSMHSLI